MADREFKPYVPADKEMPELTPRAVLVGIAMALVLGAANAYVGMKAGLTVAATFPATVMALAFLRPFGGGVLEQNIARTTASVGEALIAGAIFTIPAFLISGVWTDFNYWESTLIMLAGGVLGVLFIIFLRRVLVQESDLPFPESVACAELTKAGQAGETGAKYVFGAMALSSVIELFKNDIGFKIIREYMKGFIPFKKFTSPVNPNVQLGGGVAWMSPSASPMLMGVGYIIGWRLSALVFSGGLLAWGLLVPLMLFSGGFYDPIAADKGWMTVASEVWRQQVRPLAVGAMIVAAVYTLYRMSEPLRAAVRSAITDLISLVKGGGVAEDESLPRTERDISLGLVLLSILVLSIPVGFLYYYFTRNIIVTLVATLIMIFAGLLFAAVAGYLVGLIGSSNNPISGLTLSTLIISAVVLLSLGMSGVKGVLAVLGIAAVICCAMGIAGDMMQDLKVGYILGGTPKRMEIAEILGVVVAAFVLTWPMVALHRAYGIGGEALPAPQAGLMAMMAKGIMAGQLAWPLVIIGAIFALALILLGVHSVMLIAVGMYLPFYSTAAIFVGGLFKAFADYLLKIRKANAEAREKAENTGILVASGLIAGESITSIVLAALFIFKVQIPKPTVSAGFMNIMGFLIFVITAVALIRTSLASARE